MISLQVYDTPTRTNLLADFTGRLHPSVGGGGVIFGSDKHGFSSLECPFIPLSLADSFRAYDWPGTPHVVVSGQAAETVWEGRLETVSVQDGGIRLGAFGQWRALMDVPYTALWSDTGYGLWRPTTDSEVSTCVPERYEMDNNNRLYIALRNGESYNNGIHFGEFTYAAPHGGSRNINAFSASYDITLPANWQLRLRRANYDFSSQTTIQTIVGTGSPQTGTINQTWLGSGQQRIVVHIFNVTGSTYTMAGVTGSFYAKLSSVRVLATLGASSTNLASAIATDLANFISGINSSQLQATASLITATSTDLQDELYEDETPADILDRLALLHNYEVGVWEDRILHFWPEGSVGRDWYVDVTRILDIERDLENLRNSAYAVYRDGRGEILRTATANDAPSQTLTGLIRRGLVNVQTTSSSQAETHRDAFLADRSDFIIRAKIEFTRLYDSQGVEHPLYAVRRGDTLTMRNLPPTLSVDIDNIRSFRVGETEVRPHVGEISVSPKETIPTLVTLVARREAGLR